MILWLGLVVWMGWNIPVSDCHPTVDADAVVTAIAVNELPAVSFGAACKF